MSDVEFSREERERRVRAVVEAASRLADPRDPLGVEARRALPAATGLSLANVELSLSRHLETSIAGAELERLVTRAGSAPRVHVVLSANVFIGVVRAVALAVAAARAVVVRPSSREAVLAPLLFQALTEQGSGRGSNGLFELSNTLEPRSGDHVHVYGRRETIASIAAQCPPGVVVRGHGPGFGVAVIDGATASSVSAAERLSWDIVAFEQRGCLSPRVAFVEGAAADAEQFADALASALDQRENDVPRGTLSDEERRDRAIYRQTMQAVGRCDDGATRTVGLDLDPRALVLPPSGRHIHVARVRDWPYLERLLGPYRDAITCFGITERSPDAARLAAFAGGARILPLGNMQRPPLDGPVDLREVL